MILILPFLAFPFALIAFLPVAWCAEHIFRIKARGSPWPIILRLWGSATIAMFIGIGAFHTFGHHIGAVLLIWLGFWLLFEFIALSVRAERRAREEPYSRQRLQASQGASRRPRDSQDSE
jgi:hypothetical protein